MFITIRYRMVMTLSKRLAADDWAKKALTVIAAAGVEQVTIEGLGRDLGVTKGSFYWHFASRQALITAALELWEQRATVDVIEHLQSIADPVVRLRALFESSFGDAVDGPLDTALVAAVNDSVVGVTVRSVARRRIEFMEQLFVDMGFTAYEARIRARIAYSAYVGHFVVGRALDDAGDLDGFLGAYIARLVTSLVADRPPPEAARATD